MSDDNNEVQKLTIQLVLTRALAMMCSMPKVASFIRVLVCLACGANTDTKDPAALANVASLLIAGAMLAWSWYEKRHNAKELAKAKMIADVANATTPAKTLILLLLLTPMVATAQTSFAVPTNGVTGYYGSNPGPTGPNGNRSTNLASASLFDPVGHEGPQGVAGSNETGPRYYMSLSAILEAHKGEHERASNYGQFLHAGIDYGTFAIEGNMEMPLTKNQSPVRRSLGMDILYFPIRTKYVEPYLSAGLGYYFGSDMYNTWAADLGVGVRLPVTDYFYLFFEGSVLIPFDTMSNRFDRDNRWRRVGAGIGGTF